MNVFLIWYVNAGEAREQVCLCSVIALSWADSHVSWLRSGEEGSGFLGLGEAKVSACSQLWLLSFSWDS